MQTATIKSTIKQLEQCLQNKQYRIGIALFVSASIITAIISGREAPKGSLTIIDLVPLIFTLVGIYICNRTYGELIFGKVDTYEKEKIIIKSILGGLPLGVILSFCIGWVVFPLIWIVIGLSGVFVGSFLLKGLASSAFTNIYGGAIKTKNSDSDQKTSNEPTVECACCHKHFIWEEGYKSQDAPGSMQHNPPGYGNSSPRVFCPYCGALMAVWHITKDEWIWFADNAKLNHGRSLPPSYIIFWGQSIPPQFIPHYDEHKLNVEAIKRFEKQEETDTHKQPADQGQWKQPLTEAKQHYQDGEIAKAVESLEQAVGSALPKKEHAVALGAFAEHYMEIKDVETARKYYEDSIKTHFSAYWTAHLVLGFIYEALGDSVKAQEKFIDAQRAAPTKYLDPATEQKARDIIREWAAGDKGSTGESTGASRKTGSVDVTIKVDAPIQFDDSYIGEYNLTLSLDLEAPQLLNQIAQEIGIIRGFHSGYQLYCDKGYLSAKQFSGDFRTLREAGVKDNDALRFIDWG